jgi:hypothetical protein
MYCASFYKITAVSGIMCTFVVLSMLIHNVFCGNFLAMAAVSNPAWGMNVSSEGYVLSAEVPATG